MSAQAWNLARTIELIILAAVTIFSLETATVPLTPLMLSVTIATAALKQPVYVSEPPLRRCQDQVGLACGALLPLAIAPSFPVYAMFPALAATIAVVSVAWFSRLHISTVLLTVFIYACLICTAVSVEQHGGIPHALLGALVPFIQYALALFCPYTFTTAESALVAAGMVAILQMAFQTIHIIPTCNQASLDAMTTAALMGALLVWWLGVIPAIHIIQWNVVTQFATVFFGAIVPTYLFAWHFCAGCEPVTWVLRYISTPQRYMLLLWWILLLAVVIFILHPERSNTKRIVARKYYHILALAIFATGLAVDAALTRFASAVALAGLLLMEVARAGRSAHMREAVTAVTGGLVDERDEGHVIVTHLYLLVGCAWPSWRGGNAFSGSGLATVCAMDGAAAAAGTRWGRVKWPGGRRTVEGSLVGVMCGMIVGLLCGGRWIMVGMGAIAGGGLEAFTEQIDNLVLPMAYGAVVAACGGG